MKIDKIIELLKQQYLNKDSIKKFLIPILAILFIYSLFVPNTITKIIKVLIYIVCIGASFYYHNWIGKQKDEVIKIALGAINIFILYDIGKNYGSIFNLNIDTFYTFFPVFKTFHMLSESLYNTSVIVPFLCHINASVTSFYIFQKIYSVFSSEE